MGAEEPAARAALGGGFGDSNRSLQFTCPVLGFGKEPSLDNTVKWREVT